LRAKGDRLYNNRNLDQPIKELPMPNIAATIKAEITRLSKKEAKSATSQLKRASVQYRSDIAKLKRLLGQQEKEIKLLKKQAQQGQVQPSEDELEGVRFSARSVKAQRQRLGLSASTYGKLVGVSGLTIYAWEQGKSHPRKAQLTALIAVRGIGKREALRKLAELTPKKKGKGR
jgi:DNA-binding transcriptional regulator YiaG